MMAELILLPVVCSRCWREAVWSERRQAFRCPRCHLTLSRAEIREALEWR